jgi:hypothetical protein
VNVVVSILRNQSCWVEGDAILSATSTASLTADGVTYPDVVVTVVYPFNYNAGGIDDQTSKQIHAVPVVNGVATLDVPISLSVNSTYTGGQDWGIFAANVLVQPSISLRDVYLEVPDNAVLPSMDAPTDDRNRYAFDSTPDGHLVNPAWRARFCNADPNEYVNATTFTTFTLGGACVVTPDVKTPEGDAAGGTITQRFGYLYLPPPSGFGDKTVTLSVAGDLSVT